MTTPTSKEMREAIYEKFGRRNYRDIVAYALVEIAVPGKTLTTDDIMNHLGLNPEIAFNRSWISSAMSDMMNFKNGELYFSKGETVRGTWYCKQKFTVDQLRGLRRGRTGSTVAPETTSDLFK